jgi:hypothetical protein
MTLPFGEVWDLTWQHMQGKCALEFSILPKAPYKLFRSRMIKWRQSLDICLHEEPHTNMSAWENHSRNKSYLYVFKTIQKPKFLSKDRVRRFESKLFHFSITQDILVDTWKLTGSGEAWKNLYMDFPIKEINQLSPLNLYSRMSKGLSWGSLLAVLIA